MKALVNVPHPEAVHSIRIMLESVGFEVVRERDRSAEYVVQSLVYEPYEMKSVATPDFDLYVHVKPEQLKSPGLLFFINGGNRGENDFGVPTVTSNFYFEKAFRTYVPYFNRHGLKPRGKRESFGRPMGLLHGGKGWGYMRYFPLLSPYVDIWGASCPQGILPQMCVKEKLEKALCFVHLKSNDAPGYALYEAFASGAPIIVPRFFVENCKFQELFVDGETCLMFDNDDAKANKETDEEKRKVVEQILGLIERLRDPEENYRIGMNGLFKWRELTRWTPEKRDKFAEYLKQNSLL